MVPGSPQEDPAVADEASSRRRRRRRGRIGGVVVGVLVALVVAALLVPVPYYRYAPGSAHDAEGAVTISGATVHTDDGGLIGFPTVTFGQASIAQALLATFDDSVELVPEDEALGGRDPEENRQVNAELMADSTQTASVVALGALGYEVDASGTGAAIVDVQAEGPADGLLEVGDTVVAVDGEPVGLADDLVAAVSASPPGTVLDLEVEDLDGGARSVEVTLAARPDDDTAGLLGVVTSTRQLSFDLPFDVTVDPGEVGGPSAGLAYTLAVVDLLSPGSLSGELDVVATGTIRLDGTVGPVGAVRQKVEVAVGSEADLLLVPPEEYDEALGLADGRVQVVSVASLAEALETLESVGGDVPELEQLAAGG